MNFDEITKKAIFTLLNSSDTSSDEDDEHLCDFFVILDQELRQQKLRLANTNQIKKRKRKSSSPTNGAGLKVDTATSVKRIPKVTVMKVTTTLNVNDEQLISYLDDWEQIISEDFRKLFRMQKESFWNILQSFEHFVENQQNEKQLEIINQADRSKVLLIFLLYAGHQISLGVLSDKLKIYRRTLMALIDNAIDYFQCLASEKIHSPQSLEDKETNVNEFFNIAGLKGVIGCIEKLHFRFAPHESSTDKKPNSFCVQLACDAGGRFISYDIETLDSTLAQMCQDDFCFLASLKFSLREWTITPCYDENGTSQLHADQQLFNEKFLTTFAVLQKAIDQLQRRFQQLLCIDSQRLSFARRVLYACCGLHNFLLECNDHWLDESGDVQRENWSPIVIDAMMGEEKQYELDRYSCPRGIEKREHMIYETCILGAVEEQEIVVE